MKVGSRLPPGTVRDTYLPMSADEFSRRQRWKVMRVVVPVVLAAVLAGAAFWYLARPRPDLLSNARTSLNEQRYSQAISDANVLLRSEPRNAEAYRIRARAYLETGQTAAARQDFDRLIEMQPNDPDLRVRRAVLLTGERRFEEALRDLTQAMQIQPAAEAYFRRAACYRELGQPQRAVDDLSRAIAMDPKRAYYVDRAAAREALGLLPGAIADLTSAIQIQPELPLTYRARALLLEKAGDQKAAAADRNKAQVLEAHGGARR